ncbi:hypothetical protein GCM10010345_87290 [Streptomyces canarius]|uniref:Uncharacterized protein n=1 Tax=Streptomyces canarius TaxID=285453 RepID=A0ABQ3DBL4_9ACTN|nr:hypothetical protein GCM10010345_87290 [Streptomyces canarius]
MNSDDEQLLRGRVYGADADHPGPLADRSYVELVGGSLAGLLLDITGWTQDEIGTGVCLLTHLGQFGPGAGRCTTPARATVAASTGPATAPDPVAGPSRTAKGPDVAGETELRVGRPTTGARGR